MAANIQIYSNGNTATQTVTVSFEGEILASTNAGPITSSVDYFFKFRTGARDTSNVQLPIKVVERLSDLALNHQKQSATNTANAYSDIRSMVVDYTYDYVYGHTANQFSSGCTSQKRMKFR